MTTLTEQCHIAMVGLSREAGARTLRRACERKVSVMMSPTSWADWGPVRGEFLEVAGQTAGIRLQSPDSGVSLRYGEWYGFRFHLDGGEYSFEAQALDVAGEPDALALRISLPDEVRVRQRRKFWRARLEPSSRVCLRDGCGHEKAQATLLNLSPDGLACRADAAKAGDVTLGTRFLAEFLFENGPFDCRLNAQVRSIVPASNPNQIILGLQFLGDDGRQLAALREYLDSLGPGDTGDDL